MAMGVEGGSWVDVVSLTVSCRPARAVKLVEGREGRRFDLHQFPALHFDSNDWEAEGEVQSSLVHSTDAPILLLPFSTTSRLHFPPRVPSFSLKVDEDAR
jgi:hypothetical protein